MAINDPVVGATSRSIKGIGPAPRPDPRGPRPGGPGLVVNPTPKPPAKSSNFLWYSNKSGWAPGTDIYASLDVCKNGNGGIRGLTADNCMDLCLLLPTCQVVAYWPSWFDGPSACFSKDASQVKLLVGPTSNTPIETPDQGAWFGVKKPQ